MPLHHPTNRSFKSKSDMPHALRLVLVCLNICVVMLTFYISSTEASKALLAQRRKSRRRVGEDSCSLPRYTSDRHEPEDNTLHLRHVKQISDLVAWHIGVLDAKWYVKPRSTCWFNEYLFNIYTPDMFYDILRMRRKTFDRLLNDLRPFIEGQQTHWRQPISVEKKLVVTLFKLMHSVCIPLVADKAALGKSTVHEILRQVCTAISTHLGHLIAWPWGGGWCAQRQVSKASNPFPTA